MYKAKFGCSLFVKAQQLNFLRMRASICCVHSTSICCRVGGKRFIVWGVSFCGFWSHPRRQSCCLCWSVRKLLSYLLYLCAPLFCFASTLEKLRVCSNE